ncbi:MAG: hypothetical protein M1839_007614 [Geoglossum umbratile]|nr:MAG: hypothetical protein M1839_007614 [Geoglossum umbratile]
MAMNLGRKVFGLPPKFEESASSVRNSYAFQIEQFLNRVANRRGSSLESLFAWGRGVSNEKVELEHKLAVQVKAHQDAEGKIEGLNRALGDVESKFRHASNELHRLSAEKRNMADSHADELSRLIIGHSKTVSELQTRLETDHNIAVDSLVNGHSKEVDRLNKEITKLVGQLLVNQSDNQAWPDDKLKLKFRELQRSIESATSPRHKEFLIPQNQQLGAHLDPVNFLSRAGTGKSHILLKSIIWTIFYEQFFSAPFGFGALGPGKAQKELMDIYFAWRKIFDKPTETASPSGEKFAVFHQDKLANNWRSATFQCINVALTLSDGRKPAPDTLLAKLSADNVNQAVNRIMGVLSEVARLSNSTVKSEVEDDIRRMANLSLEIALQFGVHSAKLRLSGASRGEQVVIGEEFHDCEDGDYNKGSPFVVDLVVVPSLQKIGDGRLDMTSKRTIVPCEIYPETP